MMRKNKYNYLVPVLAIITVVAFFGIVFYVLTGNVALDNTMLGFVLGAVSTKAEQVYNYFFGSSAGSKEKTVELAKRK